MDQPRIVRVNVEVIYEDGTLAEYRVARAAGGELRIVDLDSAYPPDEHPSWHEQLTVVSKPS